MTGLVRKPQLPEATARQAGDVRDRITIVVAVAVRLYREGLVAVLSAHDRLLVEATAGDAVELRDAAARYRPDVIVLDVSLDDALAVTRGVRADEHHSRILAFAVKEDIGTILDYAEAGADGFVTVNSSADDLVEAIQRVAAGELLCSPRIAAQLLRRAVHHPRPAGAPLSLADLTHREQQVYSLLKKGRSNKEIGIALCIAEATVKNHVHHLLEKLNVSTRGQAVAAPMHGTTAGLEFPGSSRAAS